MKSIASAVGTLVLVGATLVAGRAGAHPEGHGDDPVANPFAARRAARATATPIRLVAARRAGDPDIAAAFAPFVATGAVATRRDDRFFYVESDGVPDHPLMVGIRAWQQQVPLPQPYTGDNAWPIPLHPRPAKTPASTRNRFLRGAIAVAVNGIPIFNPLNNRGEDSKAIGELDDFGGHCGRADDYHYHVAPVHLEKVVGKGKPVAWALDGYPVYGLVEPDGSPVRPLDACHGHDDPVIGYHYHAADTYPYLIGAFHGEVTERDGQVDPQPRARGVREALPPLKGAEIVGFEFTSPTARKLTYQVGGRQGTVEYVLGADGAVSFRYTDPNGRVKTEDARPRGRGPGQGPPRDGDRPPPRGQDPRRGGGEGPGGPPPGRGDRPPPRDPRQPPPPPPPNAPATAGRATGAATLVVSSPAVGADGRLPVEFTCDGAKVSPPVQWSEGPTGTRSYAVTLWHEAPDGRPPNVILFLMDDMGWRDVGFMGNRFVASPHLDRLAARGVVFTQAYASAPNCAPTRACLLSGQWTPRHGVYTVVDPRQPRGSAWHKLLAADSKSDMPTEVVTIPEALAGAGYTSQFLGMWNLGRGRRGPTTPGGQGFGRVVFPETIGFGKDEYLDDQGRFLSDRLADEAIAFIETNRARPFFRLFRRPCRPRAAEPAPRHPGGVARPRRSGRRAAPRSGARRDGRRRRCRHRPCPRRGRTVESRRRHGGDLHLRQRRHA